VTTKYLAKFQSPRAITRPKNIGLQLFYFGITDMGNTISRPLSGGDIKTNGKNSAMLSKEQEPYAME
jgi:hypothetical protein